MKIKFEDEEFIRILKANTAVFRYLANKYIDSIREYDIHDLIQEQMIACYRARNSYDGKHQISSFLYTVSEKCLLRIYAYQNRQKRDVEKFSYANEQIVEYSALGEGTSDIWDNRYIVAEQCQYIDRLIEKECSKFEKQMYEMFFKQQLDIKQIESKTGLSKTQIYNALNRIRSKVKQKRAIIDPDV